MDSKKIRQLNLRFVADVKYSRKELSEKLGYQDSGYLNQILSGHARMGDRTARSIEESLDIPKGWMDAPHPSIWGDEGKDRLNFVPDLLKTLSKPEILQLIELALVELKNEEKREE